MTQHTLKVTIDNGEMTYARTRIVCSDDGGPRCAEPVNGGDCPEFIDALGEWKILPDNDSFNVKDVWDNNGHDCGGWWWEGDHYHFGPLGSGCGYVQFLDTCGQECLDLKSEVTFEVPVKLGHIDWEDALSVTPAIHYVPHVDLLVSDAEVAAAAIVFQEANPGMIVCEGDVRAALEAAAAAAAAVRQTATGATP